MVSVPIPQAGEMNHHFAIMRRPVGTRDQGVLSGKPKKVGEFWGRITTATNRHLEAIRKTFAQSTATIETFYYKGLQTTDQLFDVRRGKLYEIQGIIDVDEEGVLHQIAVSEMTK